MQQDEPARSCDTAETDKSAAGDPMGGLVYSCHPGERRVLPVTTSIVLLASLGALLLCSGLRSHALQILRRAPPFTRVVAPGTFFTEAAKQTTAQGVVADQDASTAQAASVVQAASARYAPAAVVSFPGPETKQGGAQGWVGPQTAPASAMQTGANGAMNGFLPFCPAPNHCSVIYKDISAEPVDTANDELFHSYNNGSYSTSHMQPNFESADATLPWFTVDSSANSTLTFLPSHSVVIPTQSDDTVVPLLCGSMVQEGGGNPCTKWTGDGRDRHLAIVDRNLRSGAVTDFETYQLGTENGQLIDYSSTIWNLLLPIEEQNTGGYTSADAAGMPQVAMGVTYEDLAAGEIRHALRFTVPHTSFGFYSSGDGYGLYASPASHAAAKGGGKRAAYMGEWLRLKASRTLPPACGTQGKVIFNAMKKHGLIVTDNGRFGLFQGTYDPRIDQADVGCLSALTGADFEVVRVENAKVVAGELNPETLQSGQTVAYDQTGFSVASSGAQGALVSHSPAAPTASCHASASTVQLGSTLTLTINAKNATKAWIDNVYGVLEGPTGGRLTFAPSQTATYTAKVRGLNGYTYAKCGTVKVTGPTVTKPALSPAPGSYTSAQQISLTDDTPGATIHYTTDKSTPGPTSPVYTRPLAISSPTTVQAMATKPGLLDSEISAATYLVRIPGAMPVVLGTASTGGLQDTGALTIPYNFTGGAAAILLMNYTNTKALPLAVSCGGTNANLIASQAMVNNSPNYTVAAYYIPTTAPGAKTCAIRWPSSVYATASVTEIAGVGGLDGSAATGNQNTFPQINCGRVTSAGNNRLLLVYGEMLYSTLTANPGYRQISAHGSSTLVAMDVPGAKTVTTTLHSNNDYPGSCLSFLLKPE